MNLNKNIKFIILCFFIVLICNQSKAETKVAFVEMDKLMKESLAGKSLQKQLDKADNDIKKKFNETKEKLAQRKSQISSQKNILSKEEYEKKVMVLNKDFENFQNDSQKKITLLRSKRDNAMQKILSELRILLSEYSKDNDLTFIIDQNNIIIGRADLNVTGDILKLLDAKIKKILLK